MENTNLEIMTLTGVNSIYLEVRAVKFGALEYLKLNITNLVNSAGVYYSSIFLRKT